MRAIYTVLLAGLVSACGNADGQAPTDAAVAQGGAASGVATGDAQAVVAAETGSGAQAAASGDAAESASASTVSPPSGASATLPLPLGFYISADTACSQASNATLQLLGRTGINTSRVPCDFDRIEKTGATTYRVTRTCTEGGAAWGTEEYVSTTTSTYEILSATSFRDVYDEGGEYTMKYCPQAQLPEPWRDNDISDIVG